MHILIIPSEEFVPSYNHLAGIFQYHQAAILKDAGYKIGVVSVKQSFSIPMLVKALALKCAGEKAGNAADGYSFAGLLKLGYRKIFMPQYFLETESITGIPVYRINGFYYLRPSDRNNLFGWRKAGMTAFKRYVEEHGKPDIVHAHNAIYAGILAREIKIRYNIPYIITEHSTAFARNTITDKKLLAFAKRAYENSNGAFAVSQPFCNLLNKMFGHDIFKCLPNVLDPYLEKHEYKTVQKATSVFTFLNIGELHPKKGQLTLIKAFQKILPDNPNIKLCIGGDGELAGELKSYVAAERLEDRVEFVGSLSREQVFDKIMQSDCFVLSSKYETFGVVVIEAMLLGKPVIVTRCGGPEGFVNDDTGIIVDKDNEQQLTCAMQKMISDFKKYEPDTIRKYAIGSFGSNKFLQTVTNIYKESAKV